MPSGRLPVEVRVTEWTSCRCETRARRGNRGGLGRADGKRVPASAVDVGPVWQLPGLVGPNPTLYRGTEDHNGADTAGRHAGS